MMEWDGTAEATPCGWAVVTTAINCSCRVDGQCYAMGMNPRTCSMDICPMTPEKFFPPQDDTDIMAKLDALCDFKPTPENVNALPKGLKEYIHDLQDALARANRRTIEARKEIVLVKMGVSPLVAMLEAVTDELADTGYGDSKVGQARELLAKVKGGGE